MLIFLIVYSIIMVVTYLSLVSLELRQSIDEYGAVKRRLPIFYNMIPFALVWPIVISMLLFITYRVYNYDVMIEKEYQKIREAAKIRHKESLTQLEEDKR